MAFLGMSLASQIADFRDRGFTVEQAQTLVLMRTAAVALFKDFPDNFVLFGGANLVLFHGSVRHSADLDLIATENRPKTDQIVAALKQGLADVAEVLGVGPLSFEIEVADIPELKIKINGNTGQRLFQVDFTRIGGVFRSEIQEEVVEAGATPIRANIHYASKELMLLHKAEAFLFRRAVKARDAFDVFQLQSEGAVLTDHLANVFSDRLSHEVEREQIEDRIEKVTAKRCKAELDGMIPNELYKSLETSDFSVLRDALRVLYARWL